MTELSDSAKTLIAAFVHLPTSEHGNVHAPGPVWDEVNAAFPRTLIEPLIDPPDDEREVNGVELHG